MSNRDMSEYNRPGHSVEDISARPTPSKTIKVDLDEQSGPKLNWQPKVEEKAPEWQYQNDEGQGVSVKVVDGGDPNFDTKAKREQLVAAQHGLKEKDLILNMDDTLSEEEREAINLHNSEAVHGLKIDAKKHEHMMEKREESEQFVKMKQMANENKRKKKSSLTVDPNFYYKKRRS